MHGANKRIWWQQRFIWELNSFGGGDSRGFRKLSKSIWIGSNSLATILDFSRLMQEYLYFFCNPPMYHVSVSSSTILLDENYNAKVGYSTSLYLNLKFLACGSINP